MTTIKVATNIIIINNLSSTVRYFKASALVTVALVLSRTKTINKEQKTVLHAINRYT